MKEIIYVGNYSKNGLHLLEYENGILEYISSTNKFYNCSYVCRFKSNIYTVVEIQKDENYDGGYVVSYKENGNKLEFINYQKAYGKGPCYVTVDTIRTILYCANYTDGSFSAFKINIDGSIGRKLYTTKFSDKNSHVHCICFSQNKERLFVVNTGANKLFCYDISYEDNKLKLKQSDCFIFPKETEPRHMVIDKNNNIYVITEKSCEIYKLLFKDNAFKLSYITPIFPEGIEESKDNTGAAIKLSMDNKYIYTSNRGHNSISVFKIYENKLELIQNISSYGTTPRDISFDKEEKYMFCANQHTNNISIYKRDKEDGKLQYFNNCTVEAPSGICI